MPRITHGEVVSEEVLRQAHANAVLESPSLAAVAVAPTFERFDYLFPALQADPGNLLPTTPETNAALKALGAIMAETSQQQQDSETPAAYTYFGQFVDHDITLEAKSGDAVETVGGLLDPAMEPLSLLEVRTGISNARSAALDLDSVYGGEAKRHPVDSNKLDVGRVTASGGRPTGKDDENDVPRRDPDPNDVTLDRAALIGDARNDENTIISQLHVAFLKAHNKLVDLGYTFDQARSILRQHYQSVVVDDFLRRVADPVVVDGIRADGNRFYDARSDPFFLPLEFTVAAYRFGHTMVRGTYDFNINFNVDPGNTPASLELLFTFSALSGGLFGNPTLPENWIIEWERVIGDGLPAGGRARKLDSFLSTVDGPADSDRKALFNLRSVTGAPLGGFAQQLSVRNLLRGYRLRIPTGQAVAGALGLPTLTESQLRTAVGPEQATVLANGGLLDRTPLWLYVLAEAAHGGGEHLGPVGSTIVAEVLIGLALRSSDAILRVPGWRPALPSVTPGRFQLTDLLRFAGVLGEPAPMTTHVVGAGDTLFGIAAVHLGSGARWPEIFAANRTIVRNPSQLGPGMRLIVPSGPPDPQLRFVVVEAGDSLTKIAHQHLGSAARWPEILELNGATITNPDVIVVGQVLLLPAD